jgi:PST family polysaccharide transporter
MPPRDTLRNQSTGTLRADIGDKGADWLKLVPQDQTGRLIRYGAACSYVMIGSRYTINVAATVILARILAPSDYGLLAMATTFTVALQVFADLGLSVATIQAPTVSRETVDSCWWLNTGFGAMLCLLCVISAPVLAAFYGRHELTSIMTVLGIPFVLTGATVQPKALLERRMEFGKISFIETAALLTANLGAIIVACSGGVYWALLCQALIARIVALVLYSGFTRYYPRSFTWRGGAEVFWKFGGYIAIYNVVTYFARNIDTAVIGKVSGADAVGYYSKAHFLMTLPSFIAGSALEPVMVPAMSALRSNLPRLSQIYAKALRWVCFVSLPLTIGLASVAADSIRLVYGPKWAPVTPLFILLSVGGIFLPMQHTTGWLFISAGENRRMLIINTALFGVTASAIFVGSHWGTKGVAAAFGLATFLSTGPMLFAAHRAAGISLRLTALSVLPVFVSGLVIWPSISAAAFLGTKAFDLGWRLNLATKILAGALSYLFATKWLLPELWWEIKQKIQPFIPRRT